MGISLNTIITSALIMAVFFPAIGLIGATLPNSSMSGQFNATSIEIIHDFNATYGGIVNVSAGSSCNANVSTAKNTTCNGALFGNVAEFSAFAFIVPNYGSIIMGLFQLPYLDYLSINLLASSITTTLPGVPGFLLVLFISILMLYMSLVLILQGIFMVMKYNGLAASTGD